LGLALALLAGGCSESTNPEQDAFVSQVRSLSSRLGDHQSTALVEGLIGSQQVAASSNEAIKKLDSEVRRLFHETRTTASSWRAEVERIEPVDGLVVVKTAYGNQLYRLKLFDESAKSAVARLTKGDEILFSGVLGPERSLTQFGSLASPVFEFYPTTIAVRGSTLSQATAEIEQRLASEKAAAQEEQDARAKASIEDAIRETSESSCRQLVVSTLKYPASASFSWFKKDFVKKAENKWIYYGVVEAKNSFGGQLPVRFACDVTNRDDKLELSARLLD
jgi:hypothetical protein